MGRGGAPSRPCSQRDSEQEKPTHPLLPGVPFTGKAAKIFTKNPFKILFLRKTVLLFSPEITSGPQRAKLSLLLKINRSSLEVSSKRCAGQPRRPLPAVAGLPTRPGTEWLPPPRWPPRRTRPSKAWPWWLPAGGARRAGPGREIPQPSPAALPRGSSAPPNPADFLRSP